MKRLPDSGFQLRAAARRNHHHKSLADSVGKDDNEGKDDTIERTLEGMQRSSIQKADSEDSSSSSSNNSSSKDAAVDRWVWGRPAHQKFDIVYLLRKSVPQIGRSPNTILPLMGDLFPKSTSSDEEAARKVFDKIFGNAKDPRDSFVDEGKKDSGKDPRDDADSNKIPSV